MFKFFAIYSITKRTKKSNVDNKKIYEEVVARGVTYISLTAKVRPFKEEEVGCTCSVNLSMKAP